MAVLFYLSDVEADGGATTIRPGSSAAGHAEAGHDVKLSGRRGSAAFVAGGVMHASGALASGPPRPLVVLHFATTSLYSSNVGSALPTFKSYLGRRDFDSRLLAAERRDAVRSISEFQHIEDVDALDSHNYICHNCIGHNYIGHNYIGHNYRYARSASSST